MTLLLTLLLGLAPVGASAPAAAPSLADSTQVFYARQNVAALRALLARTEDRALALLCRYRLYPLTQDAAYLDDLPTALETPTARELALLAGLWGYRVREASIFQVPAYGLRSNRLLAQAKALDPAEPFVLLVEGQSLLFRPRLFGGDARAALDRFRRLCDVLRRAPDGAISALEADLWVWYALDRLHADEADALRADLLARNPPPLYKTFLLDPP